MNAPEPMLALQDVRRTYGRGQNRVPALDGVSLEVPAHTWTAVMGPSGSGKSTLLHVAAGLERVDGGRVRLASTTSPGPTTSCSRPCDVPRSDSASSPST
ncbi:MAG: ATP-binding cassette domain-containing protein [Nocardioides sp.]